MQRNFARRAEITICSAHRRINALQYAQHLQRLVTRAGIVDATSHSSRRIWLTELSVEGVGIRGLAELAGHASIQTTRYIDVNDGQMGRVAELI